MQRALQPLRCLALEGKADSTKLQCTDHTYRPFGCTLSWTRVESRRRTRRIDRTSELSSILGSSPGRITNTFLCLCALTSSAGVVAGGLHCTARVLDSLHASALRSGFGLFFAVFGSCSTSYPPNVANSIDYAVPVGGATSAGLATAVPTTNQRCLRALRCR